MTDRPPGTRARRSLVPVPPVRRGHLAEPQLAPPRGEQADEVFGLHGVVVEQILSGELAAPVDYDEDHDEWVVLLDGGAELDVEGEVCRLGPGDWVGEMSLLLNLPRSATVIATRDSQLRTVTAANFTHVIKEHPEETLRLLKQLSARLSQANDKLVL